MHALKFILNRGNYCDTWHILISWLRNWFKWSCKELRNNILMIEQNECVSSNKGESINYSLFFHYLLHDFQRSPHRLCLTFLNQLLWCDISCRPCSRLEFVCIFQPQYHRISEQKYWRGTKNNVPCYDSGNIPKNLFQALLLFSLFYCSMKWCYGKINVLHYH